MKQEQETVSKIGSVANPGVKEVPVLIPVSKWSEYYKYPTVAAIRQLIFYQKRNGFDKVVRRIGKRLYINTEAFFNYVEETNGAKAV